MVKRTFLVLLFLFFVIHNVNAIQIVDSINVYNINVGGVIPNETDREILRIDIFISGGGGNLTFESMTVTSNNSDDNDVSGVSVYYTDTDSNFNMSNQFGSTGTFSSGSVTFTGSQSLTKDTCNYFFIAYNISAAAILGDTCDAKLLTNDITIESLTYPTLDKDPPGSRKIVNFIGHYCPMFHNDPLHTGRSPCVGPDNPEVKWSRSLGGSFEMSSPIIDDDYTIYIGARSGILYAIRPDNTVKWTYTTGPGGGIVAAAAISMDSTIYVGSYDDKLHAVNYDGTGKWTYATVSWVQSSPAIDEDGVIHIGGYDTDLYAIEDSVTYGKKKWNYNTGGNVFSDPAVGTDGTHYNGSCDDDLYAIDKDGNLKWRYQGAAGNYYYSSPAIGSDGTIYIGNDDNKLHAVNPDGSQKWTYTTGSAICGCPAIAEDGTIYIGSRDDSLYAIEDSVTYGKRKWAFKTTSDIRYASPVIDANGVIYVGNEGYRLYAIEDSVTYGKLKWELVLDGEIWSAPAIGPDSVIYVLAESGTFYAIGEAATRIELSSFTAQAEPDRIALRWRTESEYNSALWLIYKRNLKAQTVYEEIARLEGYGSTPSPHEYTYLDFDVSKGNTYFYKLKSVKTDGSTKWYGPVSAVVTGIKPYLKISPNPFTSVVSVKCQVPSAKKNISLNIYDISGRLVKSFPLTTDHSALGTEVTWDGRDNYGYILPSGIYFCKLSQGVFTQTKKILFVR